MAVFGGLVVSALAVGTLTGCTGKPGVAAVVDGRSITSSEVATTLTELSPYLQDASASSVLNLLIDEPTITAVAAKNGLGVSNDQAAQLLAKVVAQSSTATAPVPSSTGSIAVGRLVLAEQAITAATNSTAITTQVNDALAKLDVTVNPRFGTYDTSTKTVKAPVSPSWIVDATPTPTPSATDGATDGSTADATPDTSASDPAAPDASASPTP